MALVECRECGASVSDRARSCPHCGVDSPAVGLCRLRVYRASSLTGATWRVEVYIDGEMQGTLGEGQSLTLRLEPGEHIIKVKGGGLSRKLTIEAQEDGRLSYRVVFSNWGILGGGLKLEAM